MRVRGADGVVFLFATLTQPKMYGESARDAVHRLYVSWRRLSNSTATRADFREMFSGGLRTTETTWAPAGMQREHGGRVDFDGFHAHLHIMIEVKPGVRPGDAAAWLTNAWLDASPGSRHAAQLVRRARFDDAHQLAKYVTKPLEEHRGDASVVRALFEGLHGLRLLQAFGSWVAKDGAPGWRAWAYDNDDDADEVHEPALRGPEVGELLRVVSRPIEGTTHRVGFSAPSAGRVVWVDAETAWRAVEDAFRARIAARPPPRATISPP